MLIQKKLFGDEICLEPESYGGIYGMHKYWGKKPFNIISNFIIENTEKGDVVLDSFCGSGVTAIEALRINRRSVAFDINPVAINIARASMEPVDVRKLDAEFKAIKHELENVINSLYATKCPLCGKESTVTHVIWTGDEPQEVWYKCSCKKGKIIRPAEDLDSTSANSPKLNPLWYPKTRMIANSRMNVSEGQRISDLFTTRALTGLSFLRHRIKKIEDASVRNTMELVFSGALSQASKLVFVIRNRKNSSNNGAEVGSWVVGYWVPTEHFEVNVWNCFENRYKRVLKGKKEITKLFKKSPVITDTYSEDKWDVLIKKCTATMLDLPDDSVDYVFIDPPHVNRILYLEMSLMWNSWLGLDNNLNWNDEIVISESKERNKDDRDYTNLMKKAISEIHRVLKPGKVMSIAFNSLDDGTWKNLFDICTECGFRPNNIEPLEYSATSVVQDNRKNALKTDFVISFVNDEREKRSIKMSESIKDISVAVESKLSGGKCLETYEILNSLFTESVPECFFYAPTKILYTLDTNDKFSYKDGKWSLTNYSVNNTEVDFDR